MLKTLTQLKVAWAEPPHSLIRNHEQLCSFSTMQIGKIRILGTGNDIFDLVVAY